ncbi:MAG: DUF1566 domain-containing protein [Proteobacteria bacterium]|nr:DUF1566 domain-containing protein [Pseudomonadota bacterium]
MKLSFLAAATTISLAALVSSCGSSNAQASSELQVSSNSKWKDVTTTDGTARSTCENTPANCTKKDMKTGNWWSQRLPELKNWEEALVACANLTHNGQKAGDWRLPTKDELETASANGILSAASADWIPVDEMQYYYFWSASSHSLYINYAWLVNLGLGNAWFTDKWAYSAVVCVR